MKVIVKQPNGEYAVFETCTDEFVLLRATRQAAVDFVVRDRSKTIAAEVEDYIERVDNGSYGGTTTFAECLADIEQAHGSEARKRCVLLAQGWS